MKKVFTIIPLFIVFFIFLESGDGNSKIEKEDIQQAEQPISSSIRQHFDSLILQRVTKNYELTECIKSKNNQYLFILNRLKDNQRYYDRYVKK